MTPAPHHSAPASPVQSRFAWLHHRWTTLGLFAALSLVCYIDRFILGALLTPIKLDLHLTDEQLGRLNVIFIIAYVAIVPVAGYLGDRFPRKWFIFFALLVWSFASIGSGWALTFGSLLFWRATVGFGEGIFSSLAPSWIADTFNPAQRALAFAVMTCTSQVAAWAAYHFGGIIAAESGWQHAFFVAGVPGLVLAIGVIFLREPKLGQSDPVTVEPRGKPSWPEISGFLKRPDYLLYVAGYTVRMLAVSGLFFWGAVYLHRQYGISNREATSFIGSAYFFAGVPGIFVAGLLAGRLARRTRGSYATWIAGGEILSGVAVAVTLLFVNDLAIAKGLILAQMFFAGNSWGVINPLLFELAPVRLRSTAVAVSLACSSAGSAFLASQLIGWFSDRFGIERALLLVPFGYFVAAALWLALRVRQRRGAQPSSQQLDLPLDGKPATA